MGKLITITGRDGAGKSTVLSNLACLIAKEHKTVGCMSTDLRYPSLPYFFQGVSITREKSQGMLFTHAHPASMFVEAKQKGVFVTAIAPDESCLEYEPPEKEEQRILLQRLQLAFDVLLVEAANVQLNLFSALAVRNADILINVVNTTVQGVAWEKTYTQLLEELSPAKRAVRVINADRGDWSMETVTRHFGNTMITLPYLEAVRLSEDTGIPFCLEVPASRQERRYIQQMERLCQYIQEEGEAE